MQAIILGVGDAFTRFHYGSSALVRAPAGYVLIDCPDPIHRALHEAVSPHGWRVGVGEIDDVILTHLHGDHCNGVESFGFWRYVLRAQGAQTSLPRLHTTRAVADRLWPRLAPAMDRLIGLERPVSLADYFDVRIIDAAAPDTPDTLGPRGAKGAPTTIAGLTVHARFTTHYIPTIGLLLSDGRRTLGWSGDSCFEQAHVDWLDRADLIVHETNLPPAHTPIEQLNRLPERIRAKMRLIHMPDDFDPSCSDIRPLEDGELIEV